MESNLKNFYIPDEQSIYLLSANDAKKLRDWVELCKKQLLKMGYVDVDLIGKGAYGFVFEGTNEQGQQRVFKFSRITLAPNIREKLEEEAYMLSKLSHPNIPNFIAYQTIKKQGILVMERGRGIDLHELSKRQGRLPVKTLVEIAVQLADLLAYLRQVRVATASGQFETKPIIHGDIKPSNLIWHQATSQLSLIDWGSCVYSQLDDKGQPVMTNVMELMAADVQTTNAKLGDVYFIGAEQLNGELSTPRFDEQGVAATLYALASNQNCRYGTSAIPPESLGLPKVLAQSISDMLSKDKQQRQVAGDRFIANAKHMKNWYLPDLELAPLVAHLPVWRKQSDQTLDTVVYSSRKSFLRQQDDKDQLRLVNDAQLDKYYKNYLQGMGDNEKAFIAAVSRLSEFPLVGGLAIYWQQDGISVDSNLNLFDESYRKSVTETLNNMVNLARSLTITQGTFKSCLFDAKHTIHVERRDTSIPFEAPANAQIPFDMTDVPDVQQGKQHSYFEDGDDPDERLILPAEIMTHIIALNAIHHTGCIIFEVLPTHLKIHNYYHLLDKSKQLEFAEHLAGIINNLKYIEGIGVSGFMKLPYKDAKFFRHQQQQPELFYPSNPKRCQMN